MLNVTRSFVPELEVYEKYLKKVWETGQLTNNGQLVTQLTSALTKKLKISDIELVTNGTIAIQLAIKSLNIKGDIITTPFSYVATTNSILWEGCNPVFVDIALDTLCIDPQQIESAITEQTTAILATHVFGIPCNVKEISRIAKKHNLKVIYDAAHAFGVELDDNSILNYGDASTLSFHATKLFHCGEGGAVVANSDVLKTLSLQKSFGHIGEDIYVEAGINGKMSELHAAMGLSVLESVNEIVSFRKKASILYDSLLSVNNKLTMIKIPSNVKYNYAYYPVIFRDSTLMKAVRSELMENDIFPRRYFYPSLNTLPFLKASEPCPNSESVASRILCLPLSHCITDEEISKVCKIINSVE